MDLRSNGQARVVVATGWIPHGIQEIFGLHVTFHVKHTEPVISFVLISFVLWNPKVIKQK